MSKKEKREDKIRRNITNVSLKDFEAFINQYGHIKEGAKHPMAIIRKRVFPYKRTNPMDSPYVKKILEIVDNLKEK